MTPEERAVLEDKPIQFCNFCGKSDLEVEYLFVCVAAICSECVEVAKDRLIELRENKLLEETK